jgi:hypothetical protein
MKRLLLASALVGALVAPAVAQPVPQVGVTWGYVSKATYSAGFIGLVPAASATDLVCIHGAAGKTVKLVQIKLSGSAGTLVSLPITLVKRVSLDSGGTAASTTANPANNINSRLSTQATASAVPISYTANPTINDTSPTYIDSAELTLPVTSAGTVSVPLVFDYSTDPVNLRQQPTIISATSQICVNLNAVSVSSGLVNGTLVWTEE